MGFYIVRFVVPVVLVTSPLLQMLLHTTTSCWWCFGEDVGIRARMGLNSGENGGLLGSKTCSSSRVQWKQEIWKRGDWEASKLLESPLRCCREGHAGFRHMWGGGPCHAARVPEKSENPRSLYSL